MPFSGGQTNRYPGDGRGTGLLSHGENGFAMAGAETRHGLLERNRHVESMSCYSSPMSEGQGNEP